MVTLGIPRIRHIKADRRLNLRRFSLLGEWAALAFLIFAAGSAHPYMILFSAALHEGAHIAAWYMLAEKSGHSPKLFFGGVALSYFSGTLSYGKELCVISSGCAAGLFLAAVSKLCGYPELAEINIALCAVNAFPAKGLDGGEFLLTLCEWIGGVRAYRVGERLLTVTAVLFWGAAVYCELCVYENITLLFIAVYILFRTLR